MYLLIIIFKKSEFMAAQRARPILLNERFLVYIYKLSPQDNLSWTEAASLNIVYSLCNVQNHSEIITIIIIFYSYKYY